MQKITRRGLVRWDVDKPFYATRRGRKILGALGMGPSEFYFRYPRPDGKYTGEYWSPLRQGEVVTSKTVDGKLRSYIVSLSA